MRRSNPERVNHRVAELVEQFQSDPHAAREAAMELADGLSDATLRDESRRLIESSDAAKRAVGLLLLNKHEGELPEDMRHRLVQALDDPDERVVEQALCGLGPRDEATALPALARIARGDSLANRRHAIGFLISRPTAAYPALVDLVHDSDVEIRRLAVQALATGVDSATAEHIAILEEASADPDEQVRGHGLTGLAARDAPGVVELITRELSGEISGPWAFQAVEVLADPALAPVLRGLEEQKPGLVHKFRHSMTAASAAYAGTAWSLCPRSPRSMRRKPGSEEHVTDAERNALIARTRLASSDPSTCIWLDDANSGHMRLLDLTTLANRQFEELAETALEDWSPPPTAGIMVRANWGGVVAIYRIGNHHRLIIGPHRFDLTRPGTFTHRCRGLYSAISAEQDGVTAHARRLETWSLPEAIGLGEPMLTFHEPFGGWYPFAVIARLANEPADGTAGPYAYRYDLAAYVRRPRR